MPKRFEARAGVPHARGVIGVPPRMMHGVARMMHAAIKLPTRWLSSVR